MPLSINNQIDELDKIEDYFDKIIELEEVINNNNLRKIIISSNRNSKKNFQKFKKLGSLSGSNKYRNRGNEMQNM